MKINEENQIKIIKTLQKGNDKIYKFRKKVLVQTDENTHKKISIRSHKKKLAMTENREKIQPL